MPQTVKRILSLTSTILVVLVVLLAILLVGTRLVGIKPYTVLSGSMEPTYHVGSLIYVVEVDPLTLEVDDPVTFMMNETTVATHRIIEVIPDETDPNVMRYRTQGDNNDTPDGDPVHSKNVIGKPIFTIPYLGYVANYVQYPPGRFVALGVCILLLILAIFSTPDKKAAKTQASSAPAAQASAPAEQTEPSDGSN